MNGGGFGCYTMFNWLKAQGPTFNAILITLLAAIAGTVAVSVVGWLGVLILGLAVLFLAVRIDLNEDAVAGDVTIGGTGYARQVQEMAKRDPREREAASASRAKVLAALKGVGIALFVLGSVMLFLG